MDTFSITNTTKRKTPTAPFKQIKEKVLGKNYELSLVFIGNKESRRLNQIYRNKNKPTNTLSFSLGETSGEIFIDLQQAEKEAELFDRKFDNFVAFLFIHSLLHLKGFEHSSTMEEAEEKIRNFFGV